MQPLKGASIQNINFSKSDIWTKKLRELEHFMSSLPQQKENLDLELQKILTDLRENQDQSKPLLEDHMNIIQHILNLISTAKRDHSDDEKINEYLFKYTEDFGDHYNLLDSKVNPQQEEDEN